MKKSLWVKEIVLILFIKFLLLLIIWWNFFANSSIPNKTEVVNAVFGQGIRQDD